MEAYGQLKGFRSRINRFEGDWDRRTARWRAAIALGIAFATFSGSFDVAGAQFLSRFDPGGFFGFHYQFPNRSVPLRPIIKRRSHHPSRDAALEKAVKSGKFETSARDVQDNIPKGPFEIIISIADQRVSVYGADGLIARSKVSTGTQRHPTPLGIFSVIEKQKWHRSNMYSAAPMPYMQRITWSGVALHAGVLPGHPASHGCIRLSYDFATKLWRITKLGTRVIIAPTDAMPVEIAHPHLFTPRPGDAENLIRPRPASDIPDATINVRTAAEGPPEVAPAPAPQKRQPISIFVSRKRGKLFIRQGFKTISELPVTIEDPDKPIGTFVFTAVDIRDGDAVPRWTVVAIPDDVPHKSAARNEGSAKKLGDSSRKEDNNLGADSASDTLARASAALDRISFPSDVLDRISQLLVPGSSLIISDYGMSEETSSDTDFIIVTH